MNIIAVVSIIINIVLLYFIMKQKNNTQSESIKFNNLQPDKDLIDKDIISELNNVCKRASVGELSVRIQGDTTRMELNDIKNTVNNLISSVEYNINRILNVLNAYDNNDFIPRINASGKTKGQIKEIFEKVDALGDSLSNSAKTNLNNGINLNKDASDLENAVSVMRHLLEEQVKDIENSAQNLNEVTQKIRETTNNVISMETSAKNVTESVETGHDLANQTAVGMDTIASEVTSINDAITIIDQIAFQTNILSLNAAVEAATAGEAGKGFAVVAGEVRNLATRSAQAAKEIKVLVESATAKANAGKKLSDSMKEGYDELNIHIKSTLNLIQTISQASKEQQQTIENINESINNIKTNTTQSEQMAKNALLIATQTSSLATMIENDAQEKKFS
jgi:methyl-accepting chemotaxis protein